MLKECISFFGFMITQNFTMIEKLLEVEEVQIDLEILVLTLKKKRIFFTWKKTTHWGFWVNLYGEKEYVEGVQSFSLVQIKPNLWKECKDGKGLVTEIYYGWTGGYPYMKVVQSNKHCLWSQWFFQQMLFKCCSLLCTAWRQNCRQLRQWFQSLWITMTLPVFIINYESLVINDQLWTIMT